MVSKDSWQPPLTVNSVNGWQLYSPNLKNVTIAHDHRRSVGWPLIAYYQFNSGWRTSLGIYNLLNTDAAAAEFCTYPDGRVGVHEHPLEPIMARLTISKTFD